MLVDESDSDVLLAEPVGSCTDLSATILQPLKDKFTRQFVLAPLSVLVDPERLADTLLGRPGRVGCTYPKLASDVKPGERLLIDDGLIELKVVADWLGGLF